MLCLSKELKLCLHVLPAELQVGASTVARLR